MSIITLEFEGYVQCRLATDPDPTDERRGVSGYSFALPGEPDLDWTIYTQPGSGVVERLGVDRKVGVRVKGGFCGPEPIVNGHPLYEASVFLEENPRFEERNYVVTKQQFGVVAPFKMRIKGNGIEIYRQVDFDPTQPLNTSVIEIPQATLQPFTSAYQSNYPACLALLGESKNATVYRKRRLEKLEEIKSTSRLPQDGLAAINKRIEQLKMDDPNDRRTFQLLAATLFNFPVNGPASFKVGNGGAAWLNGSFDAMKNWKYAGGSSKFPDWPCSLWFGSWDADSLTLWMGGNVVVQDLGQDFEKWLEGRKTAEPTSNVGK